MRNKKLYIEFYDRHIKESSDLCHKHFKELCGLRAISKILEASKKKAQQKQAIAIAMSKAGKSS